MTKDELPGNLPELLDYIERNMYGIIIREKIGGTFRSACLSDISGDRAICHAFRLIRAKLLPGAVVAMTQPAEGLWDKCMDCGATLRGSWTQHGPDCSIGFLIAEQKEDIGI